MDLHLNVMKKVKLNKLKGLDLRCVCFDVVCEGSEQEGWRVGERDENSRHEKAAMT